VKKSKGIFQKKNKGEIIYITKKKKNHKKKQGSCDIEGATSKMDKVLLETSM